MGDQSFCCSPDIGSHLPAFPSRLGVQAVSKMVEVFSQFTLDMQDGPTEDETDSALLFEDEVSNNLYLLNKLLCMYYFKVSYC